MKPERRTFLGKSLLDPSVLVVCVAPNRSEPRGFARVGGAFADGNTTTFSATVDTDELEDYSAQKAIELMAQS